MSDLNNYIVGIVLRFDAEGEAHAIGQFVDAVLGPDADPEARQRVTAWVNTVADVSHWDDEGDDVSGFFMRHSTEEGEPASPKGRFGPLDGNHPAVREEMPCAICGEPMQEGEIPSLVNPRPTNEEDKQKADEGRWYSAKVDIAHERCAYEETT